MNISNLIEDLNTAIWEYEHEKGKSPSVIIISHQAYTKMYNEFEYYSCFTPIDLVFQGISLRRTGDIKDDFELY